MKKILLLIVILCFICSCTTNKNIDKYSNSKNFKNNIKIDTSNYVVLYFESLTKMSEKEIKVFLENCDCILYTIGKTNGVAGDGIQKLLSKITPASGMRIAADTLIGINNNIQNKKIIIVVPTNFWYFDGTLQALENKGKKLDNLNGYIWLMTDKKQEMVEKRIDKLSNGNLKVSYGEYLSN